MFLFFLLQRKILVCMKKKIDSMKSEMAENEMSI